MSRLWELLPTDWAARRIHYHSPYREQLRADGSCSRGASCLMFYGVLGVSLFVCNVKIYIKYACLYKYRFLIITLEKVYYALLLDYVEGRYGSISKLITLFGQKETHAKTTSLNRNRHHIHAPPGLIITVLFIKCNMARSLYMWSII